MGRDGNYSNRDTEGTLMSNGTTDPRCPECGSKLWLSVDLSVSQDDDLLLGALSYRGTDVPIYVFDTDEVAEQAWQRADVEVGCVECDWSESISDHQWEHGKRRVDA